MKLAQESQCEDDISHLDIPRAYDDGCCCICWERMSTRKKKYVWMCCLTAFAAGAAFLAYSLTRPRNLHRSEGTWTRLPIFAWFNATILRSGDLISLLSLNKATGTVMLANTPNGTALNTSCFALVNPKVPENICENILYLIPPQESYDSIVLNPNDKLTSVVSIPENLYMVSIPDVFNVTYRTVLAVQDKDSKSTIAYAVTTVPDQPQQLAVQLPDIHLIPVTLGCGDWIGLRGVSVSGEMCFISVGIRFFLTFNDLYVSEGPDFRLYLLKSTHSGGPNENSLYVPIGNGGFFTLLGTFNTEVLSDFNVAEFNHSAMVYSDSFQAVVGEIAFKL